MRVRVRVRMRAQRARVVRFGGEGEGEERVGELEPLTEQYRLRPRDTGRAFVAGSGSRCKRLDDAKLRRARARYCTAVSYGTE